jgi:NitT/TauT family transport system substrate-binding protein
MAQRLLTISALETPRIRETSAMQVQPKLAALTRLVLALGLAVSCLAPAALRAQQPLKKVKIAYGGQVLNISYPWLELPGALGYWREEGLDVEVFIAQGSLQAIQLLVAGQADVAQVNSAPLVQAAINNGIAIRDVMMNTVIDWSLVVPQDSSIKTISDFKGKAIGTASLGSGGVALLKSYMQANGLEPEKDFQILPTGVGPMAAGALKSDKVQGLFYWGSAIAALENTGLTFRSFFDPEWHRLPDYSMAALNDTILREPKMIEGVVRGAAKASLFALTNPDCARRVQWMKYPSTKPSGADESTLVKWDLHFLESSLAGMKLALDLSGGKEWGEVTPDQFALLQDVFLKTKLIEKLGDPADYVIGISDFFSKANTFDHDAVVAQAKACDLK